MEYLFIEYPKCSTCQKAKKWLEGKKVPFQSRHILESTPSAEELSKWQKQSGLPLQKFFNTSSLRYRALNLKATLPSMAEKDQLALLASDGMLIKRPLLISNDLVLLGFREKEWAEKVQ